jgi:hypothetical protein
MGCRFRPGAQQQKDHRHHFVGADASAFHFNAHELGYQTVPSVLAGEPQTLLQIAFHLRKAPHHAQEADDAGDPRDPVRPSDEFRSVGRRQAEQLADDRQRQHSRISLDQVGRTFIREQPAGKIVGDGTNARLHVEDGAAAEGLVDDSAQTRVVRLVHGQHTVGERTDECRHPPAQPGRAAALLSQCECLAVLENAGRRVVCRRNPDLADDREPGL